MTDAEYEALRDELNAIVATWKQRLGLDHWKIVVQFHREGFGSGTDEIFGTAADCKSSWKYEMATLRFNMAVMAASDNREWIVIHELSHAMVNETRNADASDWLDHEERVCSRLATAFEKLAEKDN